MPLIYKLIQNLTFYLVSRKQLDWVKMGWEWLAEIIRTLFFPFTGFCSIQAGVGIYYCCCSQSPQRRQERPISRSINLPYSVPNLNRHFDTDGWISTLPWWPEANSAQVHLQPVQFCTTWANADALCSFLLQDLFRRLEKVTSFNLQIEFFRTGRF